MSSDEQHYDEAVYSDDSDYEHHDSVLSTGQRNSIAHRNSVANRQSKRMSYGRKHNESKIQQILNKPQEQSQINQTQSHILPTEIHADNEAKTQTTTTEQQTILSSDIINHENQSGHKEESEKIESSAISGGEMLTSMLSSQNQSNVFQVMENSQIYQAQPQSNIEPLQQADEENTNNEQQGKVNEPEPEPEPVVEETVQRVDDDLDYLPEEPYKQSFQQAVIEQVQTINSQQQPAQTAKTQQQQVAQQPSQSAQQPQQTQPQTELPSQQTQIQTQQQPHQQFRQRSLSANSQQRKVSTDNLPLQTEDGANEQHGHSLGDEFNVQNDQQREQQLLQSFRDSTEQQRRNRLPGNSQLQYADQNDIYNSGYATQQQYRKQSEGEGMQQQQQLQQQQQQSLQNKNNQNLNEQTTNGQQNQEQPPKEERVSGQNEVLDHTNHEPENVQQEVPVQDKPQEHQLEQEPIQVVQRQQEPKKTQQQQQIRITSQDVDLPQEVEPEQTQQIIQETIPYQTQTIPQVDQQNVEPESAVNESTLLEKETNQTQVQVQQRDQEPEPQTTHHQVQPQTQQSKQIQTDNAQVANTQPVQQQPSQQHPQQEALQQEPTLTAPQPLPVQEEDEWPSTYGQPQQLPAEPQRPQTNLQAESIVSQPHHSDNESQEQSGDQRVQAESQQQSLVQDNTQVVSSEVPSSLAESKNDTGLISVESSQINQSLSQSYQDGSSENQFQPLQASSSLKGTTEIQVDFRKSSPSEIVKSKINLAKVQQTDLAQVQELDVDRESSSFAITSQSNQPMANHTQRDGYVKPQVEEQGLGEKQFQSEFIKIQENNDSCVQSQSDVRYIQSDIPQKAVNTQQSSLPHIQNAQISEPDPREVQPKKNEVQASEYFVVDKNLSSLDIYGRSEYNQLNQPQQQVSQQTISERESVVPHPLKSKLLQQAEQRKVIESVGQIPQAPRVQAKVEQKRLPSREQQKQQLRGSVSNADLAMSTNQLKTNNKPKKQKAGSHHNAPVDNPSSCKCEIF